MSSERAALAAVLCVAAVARLVTLDTLFDGLNRDPDGYRALANSLAQFGVLGTAVQGELPQPSAFRPPLYPLLLVPCVACGRHVGCCIGLMQLISGVATVWLTWRLALSWQLSLRGRVLAGTLVAIDPILLFQTAQVMTETVAALLAVGALLAVTRAGEDGRTRSAALAGSLAAVTVLCRPTFLIWLVLVAAVLALQGGQSADERSAPRRSRFARFGPCGAFIAAAALTLAPWIVRNAMVFGRPILTTTHGGYTLLLGNNPLYYDHLRTHSWHNAWQAEPLQDQLRAAELADGANDELARDRVAYRLAGQAIARNPGMFVVACVTRFTRLWGVLPLRVSDTESANRRWSRHAVAAGYAFELALACLGLWRIGRRLFRQPWLWSLLLAGSFTAVHAFYWSDLRMRAPLVPIIALAAGAALNEPRRK
jgi:hypothetical protein